MKAEYKHQLASGNLGLHFSSVQFSSVAQSCPTLCDPTNRSTPGLPVHHQLPEFTQTRVHRVSDAIQPSHPRSSYSVSILVCKKGKNRTVSQQAPALPPGRGWPRAEGSRKGRQGTFLSV